MRGLREDALTVLMRQIPTSWEDVLEMQADMNVLSDFWKVIKGRTGLAIELANLSIETDAPVLLPFIYYLCASQHNALPDILSGKTRGEGKEIVTLVPTAQHACIIGREILLHEQSEWVARWSTEHAQRCLKPDSCNGARRTTRSSMTKNREVFILRAWLAVWSWGLCDVCSGDARRTWAQFQKNVWERLPSIFGLGTWDEVRSKTW
jgi:hypothetical protein